MAKSRVTFQSAVPPWECDIVEHFTVAFYYQKLDWATAAVLRAVGLDPTEASAPYMTACRTQFGAELVKGDIYQIESVSLEPDRLGHRLVNAETGAVCTHFDQRLSAAIPPLESDGSGSTDAAWDGPEPRATEPVPAAAQWLDTGRDVSTERDYGLGGGLTSHACILRFSAGGEHLRTRIGMTPSYVREHDVGFSTFSFDFRFYASPPRGTPLVTQSTVASIGRSSLRIEHRLLRDDGGDEIARLTQMGVHLDKRRRRPSPFPAAIAAAARRLSGG